MPRPRNKLGSKPRFMMVRLNEEDWERVESLVEEDSTLSSVIRAMIRKEFSRRKPKVVRRLREIAK